MALQKNTFQIIDEIKREAESCSLLTYISLFSSAGVGCYGFQEEGFRCIATTELLERRIAIQKYNKKCPYDSGYICGDMTKPEIKGLVSTELQKWREAYKIKTPDVLIATPPCQGMSVANHKKHPEKEIKRNSLVIESISMTLEILPKAFVFENVQAFLDTICVDRDEKPKAIKDAIDENLSGKYNILYRVVNFKDYGNNSSRTRTLVIGTRKDLVDICPFDLFPNKQNPKTLRQVIGHLPSLNVMGETSKNDIFHNFKPYLPEMRAWIENLKEGEGAFDNENPMLRPHRIVDGEIVFNVEKNADKYTRQRWDYVAPCVHTRNDILASQNTIHPVDDRVFSIRELMLMMSIPDTFHWTEESLDELNSLDSKGREAYLRKNEANIRQTIGEAVPTIIFKQIAQKYREHQYSSHLAISQVKDIISRENLTESERLRSYITNNSSLGFSNLTKIAELANAERDDTAAYYTGQNICYEMISTLPRFVGKNCIRILEPSVGVGNFLPCLFSYYSDVSQVFLDVVDINPDSILTLKSLLSVIGIPSNFEITFITDDFLLHNFGGKKYDVVIGNPPYMQLSYSDVDLLRRYRFMAVNSTTNNLFAFFIEKALQLSNYVSLVVPKSLINAPEFNDTRDYMDTFCISDLVDYGEKGFKGVKIETLAFTINTKAQKGDTRIVSYITEDCRYVPQAYYTEKRFPYWLIYRNDEFTELADRMRFGLFDVFRDRKITKKITTLSGKYRVLKSRNIGDRCINDIADYDSYVDSLVGLSVSKYLDNENCILVPNLTYSPRGCRMPKGCIADGSVAILTLKDKNVIITDEDIAFWATDEFRQFYMIARNKGTRSLNIDNNSVFFFGILI